ncbi:GDSL esterase/lipase At4g10955-like [Trifolium pratense]|uniref:GDSL esterase/lipase At4g10955-like n=1 Tax=Trifolium pratense TaxID=57577 RepID=UPI001E692A3B|nr:GDSL esterase/lipase At4g10955-like [Trifolium pratense]
MTSESTDNFYSSGPSHLTYVNWDNEYHRKSVASSLVNGVYVLENDRQKQRKGPDSLACKWWEFFHFKLLDTLIDDVDSSIFGAIYEFKPQPSMCNNKSPRYVIAFRGTIIKPESFLRDMELDLKILRHGLHRTSRAKIATEAVRKTVLDRVGGNGSKIWLAGHSLGSSIALHAGKTLAKSGIESFLFNPPFPSAPLDQIINNKKAKHGIRCVGSTLKFGVGFITMNSDKRRSSNDSFSALSAWIPNLFVNPSDCICSGYVGYFEHRSEMEKYGAGRIEKRATQISVGCEFMRALGMESEPLHLIPSAILKVNLTPQKNCIEAQGIDQWWKPNLQLKSEQQTY